MSSIIIAGSIGYYLATNEQQPASNTQNEQQVIGHTESSVDADRNNNENSNTNPTVIIPQMPAPAPIWQNNEEVEIFREYLRIPTVHPDIDYSKAI